MAENEGSGLKLLDGVLLLGAGAIAVVVAFALLHFIVGVVWFLVKALVVVAFVGFLARFLFHRRN